MFSVLRYAYGVARGSTVVMVSMALLGPVSAVLLIYLVGRAVAATRPIATGSDLTEFGWLLCLLLIVFVLTSLLPVWGEVASTAVELRLDRAVAADSLQPMLGPTGTSHLEDPDVQDTYARAREVDLVALSRGPSAVASIIGSRVLVVGSALLIGVLFVWWIVPILVVSVTVVEWWIARSTNRETAAWAGQTEGQRRASYLQQLSMGEGAQELRIFGLGSWLADRHTFERMTALAPVQRLRWRYAGARLALLAAHIVIIAAALVFTIWSAWNGDLSLAGASAVVPAILLIGTSYDPVNLANAGRARAAYRALRELPVMIADRHPDPGGEAADFGRSWSGLIRFEGVCFRYPGQDRDVLHDLDLELAPGQAHALVGINGAGKSTLVKLLAGCYQPTAGRITVDGVDLATLDSRSLRQWQRRIAAIVQDFLRLPVSIADNIALGAVQHRHDQAAVNRAATTAGIAEVVAELPNRWDTVLDRNVADGAELSGGQWQRLALARALYAVDGGAALLVLDEPAAALDVRAEADLVDQYLSLTEGVTSLIISHRFSVVRPADRIWVLDNGRIAESGTHDELIGRRGPYASMFQLQADRYLGTDGGRTDA